MKFELGVWAWGWSVAGNNVLPSRTSEQSVFQYKHSNTNPSRLSQKSRELCTLLLQNEGQNLGKLSWPIAGDRAHSPCSQPPPPPHRLCFLCIVCRDDVWKGTSTRTESVVELVPGTGCAVSADQSKIRSNASHRPKESRQSTTTSTGRIMRCKV